MDSKFLFGIETENDKDNIKNDEKANENLKIVKNISEEIELVDCQFKTIKQQIKNMDIDSLKYSFSYQKCCLIIEYLTNIYNFHCLKTQVDEFERMKILKRINNLKCILDRLAPIESRLNSYLKDLSKNQDNINDKKLLKKDDKVSLKPNLSAFVEDEKLNPKLSNLIDPKIDKNKITNLNKNKITDKENFDSDSFEESSEKIKPIKRQNKESSIYVPSKCKYVPYDDTQNQKLTNRERKELEESKQHKLNLQKSIIDDLMNTDNDIPITTGMREPNNAGYFDRNKVATKSSLKRDLAILKDKNYTLMMNNDQDEFLDKNLEELNKVLSKKLNSKKHQKKLKKRRELRTKFRKRNKKSK